jgi:uncharacterized cupin superfamily protein
MSHSKVNIDTVEDIAPNHGMGELGETRPLRSALGAQAIGAMNYRWKPGKRTSFGHTHEQSEEMYVVLKGSGRMKVDEEVVELAERDILYVAPGAMREWEAGPDGIEILAFGGHVEGDATVTPGWWRD